MISGVLENPLDLFDACLPAATLRRLQGELELRRLDARQVCRRAGSVQELVAATQVAHLYEAAIGRCRRALLAKKGSTGWRRGERSAPARPRSRPSPRLRVVGATPPPKTGHGWPALLCAGSAAACPVRSLDAVPPPTQATASPAQPAFFCPDGERISNENNTVEGIHYAHIWTPLQPA